MASSSLLLGLIPLLFFVIVDSFAGPKYALWTAILLAGLEAGFTYYYYGELDAVTAFSIVLVCIFAGFSLVKKNSFYIKIQPVVLNAFIGTALIISFLIGRPLLLVLTRKYKDILPGNVLENLGNPVFIAILEHSTHFLAYGLFLHGALVYYTALYSNNWVWLISRGVGFYFFSILSFIAARVYVSTIVF